MGCLFHCSQLQHIAPPWPPRCVGGEGGRANPQWHDEKPVCLPSTTTGGGGHLHSCTGVHHAIPCCTPQDSARRKQVSGHGAHHVSRGRNIPFYHRGGPVDRGVWTAKTVKRPRQQPAHPQYANYWAPLTRKRHTMPHSAQSQHANYWAPRTRKRHQQEHRPQRPTESSDPTQHAKGRTGDRPGPRKGATTRRNVTQGGKEVS